MNPWNLLIETPLWRPGQALNETQQSILREAHTDHDRCNITKKWGRKARGDLPLGLTTKQLMIARYMIEGYSNAEIAQAMCIAESTVTEQVSRACARVGCERTNRVRLAVLVDRALREAGVSEAKV